MQLKFQIVLIALLLISTATLRAQNVGIGTSAPNSSAKLEISDPNRGFLPPRVALTSTSNITTPISSPVSGLMVYNTATAGSGGTAVTPGYYYCDGTQWVRMIAPTNTNTLTSSGNTITSTANGIAATASAVNSVSNSSSTNTLTTTVNGVAGTGVNIINSNATSLSGKNLITTINGVASTALDLTPAITAATTHTLGLSGNTLTSTVNGVAATSSAIGTVSNTSSGNNLTTTINGIAGTSVPMINSHTFNVSGNVLTSSVNGVSDTTLAITSVGNTSSANTMKTTINGISGSTVPIINTNTLGLSGNTLSSTINGVAATSNVIGSVSNSLSGTNLTTTVNGVAGSAVDLLSAITPSIPSITLNSLGLSSNTLTSTVNLVGATSNTISSVSNTSSANNLSTTINGVVGSTVPIVNTVANTSSANTIKTTVNGVAGSTVNMINSNTTSLSGTNLTTTVNGVAAIALDLTSAITSKAWSLTGNSGTSYASNFLGTTDNKSLRIKTNNTARMIVDSLGKVGIGTASPTNVLHVYAASNPLRIEGLQTSTSATDNLLSATSTQVVNKSILGASYFIGHITSDFSSTTTNSILKIISQNEVLDLGNEYNSSTGIFSPVSSGTYIYEIELNAVSSSLATNDYGSSPNPTRNVMGFVDNSTNKWIGRFNYELPNHTRSYYCKGVVNLTAGSSYYFGVAFNSTTLISAYPATSVPGTRFSIRRIN